MINKFRRLLIQLGKALPFIISGIVLLNHIEILISLILNDFMLYQEWVVANSRISYILASYFMYDIVTLFVVIVIAIAIETCVWNKLTCLYLGVNLLEKSYFDFELEIEYILIICTINIVICAFLCYKGISKIL